VIKMTPRKFQMFKLKIVQDTPAYSDAVRDKYCLNVIKQLKKHKVPYSKVLSINGEHGKTKMMIRKFADQVYKKGERNEATV